jgi:hypothetical protein
VLERKPLFSVRNSKHEIRNNDQNTNFLMTLMTNTLYFQCVSFGHFVIWYSNLFRISDFDIRILSEHDFSFRHYLTVLNRFNCKIFSIAFPSDFTVEIFHGSEHPFMGWRSTIYGAWEPIYSIVFSFQLSEDYHCKTILNLN